jgi:hypothetical protein
MKYILLMSGTKAGVDQGSPIFLSVDCFEGAASENFIQTIIFRF